MSCHGKEWLPFFTVYFCVFCPDFLLCCNSKFALFCFLVRLCALKQKPVVCQASRQMRFGSRQSMNEKASTAAAPTTTTAPFDR